MVERDATRMCELLVGLEDVAVLGVEDDGDACPLVVHVESTARRPGCPECGLLGWSKDRPKVTLVDLPCFGRSTRLVWHKHRLCCPDACPRSWTVEVLSIAPPRQALTTRAGKWATIQVGSHGRAVSDVADELGCDWHTVNAAVMAWGELLVDDPERMAAAPAALGLDETLFCRRGRLRTQQWCTSIVDVGGGGLIDIVEGKHWAAAAAWIAEKPAWWREQVSWGVLDLSGSYAKTFRLVLAHAAQVADPFHVCKLANAMVDDVRRRVQNETLGHRGRKADPLYRARRLLTKAHERLDDKGNERLVGLLGAGDPKGEVRDAWHVKETVRGLYDVDDHATAVAYLDQLADDLKDRDLPAEARRLGRTLRAWRAPITNWHASRVTNGPTEAANNLIKRIKRVAFGLTSFRNHRIRVLLYAGRPNWDLLATITPC